MSRSRWKGPYIHSAFLKKTLKRKSFIWSRDSLILSAFVGYRFMIHTGKTFKKFFVTREKIGYKFGEFCTTRGKFFHKNKLKPSLQKKQSKVKK